MYQIEVGNIGAVYIGESKETAIRLFDLYVDQSVEGYGSATGENVTMLHNDEIVQEFIGALNIDGEN